MTKLALIVLHLPAWNSTGLLIIKKVTAMLGFAKTKVHHDNTFVKFEPRSEKTGILHMRKQRRRSASQ